MRLFNILLSLAQKVGAIDDYVVETGTSGVWQYQKWNSGKMEAWIIEDLESSTTPQALMGGMYGSVDVAIPQGFISAPRGVSSARLGTGAGFTFTIPQETQRIIVGILSNQGISGEQIDATIHSIILTGKWK